MHKNKKKLLFIEANRDGTIGGSYYSLLYLLQGLDKDKYEPHVLFCQENTLIPQYKMVTDNIHIIDFDPSVSSRAASVKDILKWPYRLFTEVILKQFELHRIIRKINPDLVHLNNGYAATHEWMLAACLHKIKIISHDRGTRPPSSLRTKLFVRCLDAIISVSDSYKNNVINDKLSVRKLYRVYNGLDYKKWTSNLDMGKAKSLKSELGITDGQRVIGIVGNIDKWKGQHIVISAINQIKRDYPDIVCLIVGRVCAGMEQYKSELDNYISENDLGNNVIFMGYQSDIPTVLSIFDVFVHASIEPEPFGRVILEAMALEKPIIATNGGGIPEIIINEQTGLLVPMNNSEEMASAMMFYLNNQNEAKRIGQNGKERLLNEFSIKKMVDGVESVYNEVFAH